MVELMCCVLVVEVVDVVVEEVVAVVVLPRVLGGFE